MLNLVRYYALVRSIGVATLLLLCSSGVAHAESTNVQYEASAFTRWIAPIERYYSVLHASLPPEKRAHLDAEHQRYGEWVKACAYRPECAVDRYKEWQEYLETQYFEWNSYRPDLQDQEAFKILRALLEGARQQSAETPVSLVRSTFSIPPATWTVFTNEPPSTVDENGNDDDKRPRFPRHQPEGVSDTEWAALLATGLNPESEHGKVSYRLLDLDGDGARDLIINAYTGGTGLFSKLSLLRQQRGRFESALLTQEGVKIDELSQAWSLDIGARGMNEALYWLQINGRIYGLWQTSRYGRDTLHLLRPFTLPTPGDLTVTLFYRYEFYIPEPEGAFPRGEPYKISRSEMADLKKAIAQVRQEGPALDYSFSPETHKTPLCPIPHGTPEAERYSWFGFGAGHSQFEIIQDLRVNWHGQCYVGQLINWFGRYEPPRGLLALLRIRPPAERNRSELSFAVFAHRKLIRIQ